MTEVRDYRC